MAKGFNKQERLERRKRRIRKKIVGTSDRPRLQVHRTLKHIYAQVIDDTTGRTLVATSSVRLKIAGSNKEAAEAVGKDLAERARANAVERVRFDRGGRLYHGRIKSLADAARKAGLNF